MSESDAAIAWETSARIRGLEACAHCKRPLNNPHDTTTVPILQSPSGHTVVDVCTPCWALYKSVIAKRILKAHKP